MAARKLQAEIDKTIKKVHEGVELFEETFDKIATVQNLTQKDKYENDLKTQIKKLQRHRDQIKTWQGSSDIKDKQPLADVRRLIEQQMERFKATEKEMKTKAFSKEGLNSAAKLDPKEQQKVELCGWISSMVDELSHQVETAEAEVEGLQLTKKKKDAEAQARIDELERVNERRAWHVNRLELILRLLENGNLQTDAVTDIKDDIAYFVESNQEEDFDEDEGIYDDLNLEEEEDNYNMGASTADNLDEAEPEPEPSPVPIQPPAPAPAAAAVSAPPKTPAKKDSKDDAPERVAKAAKASPTSRKNTADSTTPKPVMATPTRQSSGPAPTPVKATPAPLPPIRYAAAAAAANASAAPPAAAAPATAGPPGFTSTPLVAEPAKDAPPSEAAAATPSVASSLGPTSPPLSAASAPTVPASESPAPSATSAPSVAEPAAPAAQADAQPASQDAQQQQRAAVTEQRLPSSLADLVASFERTKQKSIRRENDLSSIHRALDAGFSSHPQPTDAEKPKYYVPRNPFNTPAFYPQEPSGQFASAALFGKLDIDTLFYIFYYCQGTYLQYLAASELKKQSWRFHKQYLTWFQRANEPQQITEEYEQGVYLYFDWEGSWCQRRKSDFKFEYRFLETE